MKAHRQNGTEIRSYRQDWPLGGWVNQVSHVWRVQEAERWYKMCWPIEIGCPKSSEMLWKEQVLVMCALVSGKKGDTRGASLHRGKGIMKSALTNKQ